MTNHFFQCDEKVSIGGRNITNLRLPDDIDVLAEEEQELEALVESLDKTCTILIQKLSSYKLSECSLLWFKSYLNNRTQTVHNGQELSDSVNVKTGVPQGSILGLHDFYYSLTICRYIQNFVFLTFMLMVLRFIPTVKA